MPPVLEKPLGLRCHLPQAGREIPPDAYEAANLIDGGIGIIALFFGGEALAFVEEHFILILGSLALLGLWNGRDELGAPASFDDFLGRLPVWSQFPMARRPLVRGVDDWVIEERVGHCKQYEGRNLMNYGIYRQKICSDKSKFRFNA